MTQGLLDFNLKDPTHDELDGLHEIFQMLDQDGDGIIHARELAEKVGDLNLDFSEQDIKDMLLNITADGGEQIDFPEFIVLMTSGLSPKENSSDEEIIDAFKVFDKEESGFISVAELELALTSLGMHWTQAEAREFIAEMDADGDGQVDYIEFIKNT